jgi:outer membrane lipoprotein SlyB
MRRAPIHAEIVELYHAPSGEKVDVEGAIESGGRGRKTVVHTVIGAGAAAILGLSGQARFRETAHVLWYEPQNDGLEFQVVKAQSASSLSAAG